MKLIKNIIAYILVVTLLLGQVFAQQMPQEFFPNHNINKNRDEILDTLTELQAYRKTGNPIPSGMFGLLYKDFQAVFPYFPDTPNNNLIYRQCELSTQTLVGGVNDEDYATFMTKCFDPISNILRDIAANYTVRAVVTATPKSGSAPLSVTFDASKSTDPSNETIPNNNFYRYFTDTAGRSRVIGRGPVVNYTFPEAGSYIVHTTVRSINNDKGYFDGAVDTQIIVSPADTKINISANGIKLDKTIPVKLSVQEGANGVTFDATSTLVSNGKKIISHTWTVSSADNSFNFTRTLEQAPGQLKIAIPNYGIYNISLSTKDNTNTVVTEKFTMVFSDPVAKIKGSSLEGTTSTNFGFDGDTSYGVSSQIDQYMRDILDENGNRLYTSQEKNLKYNFDKPGLYTARLTVKNKAGLTDTDTKKITVTSTPPVPGFTITPSNQWLKPSEYILDAGSSFDIDELKSSDKMSFERSFSNNENVNIVESTEDNKRIVAQFDARGSYKIQLTVKDNYGKSSTLTRDLNIATSLRPQVEIEPIATAWGNKVTFKVNANKPIINYKWSFGDGATRTVQTSEVSHVYNKVGIYKASVTVSDKDLDENTITSNVFIGENEKPIGVYQVSTPNGKTILPTESCVDGSGGSQDAYSIARYEQITIDGTKSVDIKGLKNNLNISFKPQNDDISNINQLRYKFGELGCQYVDMIVEDKVELSADKKKIRFKVKNGLPIMDNLYLTFPQYSNDIGIGFFQYSPIRDPNFQQFDPLIVKVNVENPRDLDGNLSYIAWYYYKADDPDRLLDIKVTPGINNSVNFALSREAGEYTFGAKMIDNDGGEIRSEDIIGKGPSIFIQPKGNNNVDIPIVTLQTDRVNTKVGEEVTFVTNAKVLSARPDFKANRILKYDFDGDGIDDLTTKDDVVKFIYTNPNIEGRAYKPKVKVIYRDKVGIGYSEQINVKKGLKANFIIFKSGKKVLVRDVTYGTDQNTMLEYCMDKDNCNSTTIRGKKFFEYNYKDYGDYTIRLRATDQYGNSSEATQSVSIKAPEKMYFIDLLSTPGNKLLTNGYEIDVGKSLNNQIILYMQYFGTGDCYIDKDLTDGEKERDLECNKLHDINVGGPYQSRLMKVWYENSAGLTNKIIKINLIDNKNIIPSEYEQANQHISSMISDLQKDSNHQDIVEKLSEIQSNLGDKEKTTELLIDLAGLTTDKNMSDKVTSDFDTLYNQLGNEGFRATLGLSEYERLKREISSYATPTIQGQIEYIFNQIDTESNKTTIYTLLSQILQLFGNEVGNNSIESTDYDIIKGYICDIVAIKEIPNTKCDLSDVSTGSTANTPTIDTTSSSSDGNKSFASKLIRRLLIIIGIVLFAFIILVIIFAVKARIVKKSDNTGVEEKSNT